MCIYLRVFPDCLKMLNCKTALHTKLIMNYTIGNRFFFFLLQPCAMTTTWFMLNCTMAQCTDFHPFYFISMWECSQFFRFCCSILYILIIENSMCNTWRPTWFVLEVCIAFVWCLLVWFAFLAQVFSNISFCSVDLKPLGRRILWHTFFSVAFRALRLQWRWTCTWYVWVV